jgi:hypothetical protein
MSQFRVAAASSFTVLISILTTGCAVVTTRYAHAVPVPAAGGRPARDGVATAALPDADVAVEAQDGVATWTFLLPLPVPFPHLGHHRQRKLLPFWIELAAHRGSELSLDPAAIRVVNAGGDTLQVAEVTGPGLGSRANYGFVRCRCGKATRVPEPLAGSWRSRNEPDLEYSWCFDCVPHAMDGERPAGPTRATSTACWVVAFPHPGDRFTLLLDGVRVDGRPQPPVTWRFVHGASWRAMLGFIAHY